MLLQRRPLRCALEVLPARLAHDRFRSGVLLVNNSQFASPSSVNNGTAHMRKKCCCCVTAGEGLTLFSCDFISLGPVFALRSRFDAAFAPLPILMKCMRMPARSWRLVAFFGKFSCWLYRRKWRGLDFWLVSASSDAHPELRFTLLYLPCISRISQSAAELI